MRLWNAARSALLHVTTSSAVHKSTMSRLWQRLNTIGAPEDRPRSCRPRITTHTLDRYIWVFHLRGRPRRPFVGPVLTQIHRRARARWCHALRVCTLRNWCWIWISDVSHFLHSFGPTCVQEVDRFGGGSVIMLAAISYNRRTNIVRVQEGDVSAGKFPFPYNKGDRGFPNSEKHNCIDMAMKVAVFEPRRTSLGRTW